MKAVSDQVKQQDRRNWGVQTDLMKTNLTGPCAGNVGRVADHVLGQRSDTHATNVIHRVASSLGVVANVPFLCTEDLRPLYHVQPPVRERHMRLRMPATRSHNVRTPREHI